MITSEEAEALRAERDEYKKLAIAGNLVALEMRIVEADRDRLAAANAALEAQVARLVGLLKKSRRSVANRAYGWPEAAALLKEVDAALAEVQA